MSRTWFRLLLLGAISLIAMDCFAEQHANTPRDDYNAKREASVMPKRSTHSIKPSKTLNHIFENLYYHPQVGKTHDLDQWKHTKEKLRSLASVHFTDSIQIGFDRVKTGPSKYLKGEIVDVNPHLAPKTAGSTARGFGLQMRVKLD